MIEAIAIAFVLVLVFWSKFSKLKDRVSVLEQALKLRGGFAQNVQSANRQEGLSEQVSATNALNLSDQASTSNITSTSTQVQPPIPPAPQPDVLEQFTKWFSHDWPMKVGALMLIIAVGWFVSYAFANDWIGPVGRVGLGLVFGMALLVVGMRRAQIAQTQGNVLMVIGAATTLVTMLAGVGLYDMFSAEFTLVVMLGVVALMMAQVVVQRSIALGVVNLVFGGIVPFFMIDRIEINTVFLYLFVLIAGTLWVSWKLPQRVLSVMALVIVAFYSIALNAFIGFEQTVINTLFAIAFVMLFYVTNMVTMIRAQNVGRVDVMVAGGTGMLFWLLMYLVLPENMVSMALIAGALVAVGGAFALHEIAREKCKDAVVVYAAVAFTLIAVATALELKSDALVVAYAAEFGALLAVLLYLSAQQGKNLLGKIGALLYAVPVFLLLETIGDLLRKIDIGVVNDISPGFYPVAVMPTTLSDVFPELFAIIVVGVIAGGLGLMAARNIGRVTDTEAKLGFLINMRIFWGVTGMLAMVLVWALAHLLVLDDGIATMIALAIYTVAAVKFYISGAQNQYSPYRIVAVLLFAVVLGRLFLVEFWQMDIVAKIITFFVIGALFMSTSFLARSGKNEKLELN